MATLHRHDKEGIADRQLKLTDPADAPPLFIGGGFQLGAATIFSYCQVCVQVRGKFAAMGLQKEPAINI
jgi:hypothetical protein